MHSWLFVGIGTAEGPQRRAKKERRGTARVSESRVLRDWHAAIDWRAFVDRGFLIWLSHQDRNELLTEAELPDPRDIQPTLTQ